MVGRVLREKRNKLGYSLEEVAGMTHIRLEYLRDIEDERFDRIPSELYVRGYLKSYARSLGLDGDNIIELYCGGKSDPEEECIDPGKVPLRKMSVKEISIIAIALLFMASVLILTLRYDRLKSGGGTEVAPGITEEKDSERENGELKFLRIVAHETTWLIIVTDNKKVDEHILKKGDVLTKRGYYGFHIKVGNAGGVSVFLDNENIGYLGDRGKVVKRSIPEDYRLSKAFRQLFQERVPLK